MEWDLDSVEPVKEWLRGLRTKDPELSKKIASDLQTLKVGGVTVDHRPLVDSLAGPAARRIGLKELRTEGTIRIAFVRHAGVIILLLAHGDKRHKDSARFYDKLITEAVEQYEKWLADREGK